MHTPFFSGLLAVLCLVCLPVHAQQFSLQPVAPASADAKLLATQVDDYLYLSFDRPLSTRLTPGLRLGAPPQTTHTPADAAQMPTLFLPGPGGTELELVLYPVDLYGAEATIRLLTPTGEQRLPVPRDITYRGYVRGQPDRRVSLLIDGDYVYGSITDGKQRSYLVSASVLLPGAPVDRYLLYDQRDRLLQKSGEEADCGTDAPVLKQTRPRTARKATGNCYEVRLGIASDYSMYAERGGSVQAVIDHAIGVMLDVESDYELADFDDQLTFEITEQVISTCAACDPWTASTDPSELLNDFTVWKAGGGFQSLPQMGQLWTNRDFDGTTIGLARVSPSLLCNDQADHVLQDVYTDPDFARVLTSHEIGHNLNARHDASGSNTIMAPRINLTTDWSTASVAAIDGTVDGAVSCLNACAPASCSPVEDLEITDVTANGFDARWSATAEATYRIRVYDDDNGTLLYEQLLNTADPGAIEPPAWQICTGYRIGVENKCGEGDFSAPVTAVVKYTAAGCADFTADTTVAYAEVDVQFADLSVNASSWLWDFGDGTSSTEQNPLHTYSGVGGYTVRLSVNGGSHEVVRDNYLTILPTGLTLPYTAADGGNMEGADFATTSLTPGKTSLFERGVPTNFFTNTTASWVTVLDGDVPGVTRQSALYSPAFDFSAVAAPVVRFDLGMETQFSNAPYGVQLQYSTDEGANWSRLGSSSDDDWYNRGPDGAVQLATGVFADGTGWLLTTRSTSYAYDLGFLNGTPSVIFRFVFSVAGGYGGGYHAGAMLDNFAVDGSSDLAAPVDLLSFTGQCQDDRVNLHWQTATETDNAYFLIERRRADDGTFELLEKVAGAGNSQVVQDYRTTDPSPDYGLNYYRLTQVDFDGTATVYDDLVAVEYAVDGPVTLYPNPVSGPVARLDVPTATGGPLTIEVIDDGGRRVYRREVTARAYGNTFDLPVGEWPAGGYTVRTVYAGRVSVHRLLHAKGY